MATALRQEERKTNEETVANTKSSEVTAQAEYDGLMIDSKVDNESKMKDIEHRTAKQQDESRALTVKKEDQGQVEEGQA
eukprot:8552843-Heterocapsa_arctica.AAC.1